MTQVTGNTASAVACQKPAKLLKVSLAELGISVITTDTLTPGAIPIIMTTTITAAPAHVDLTTQVLTSVLPENITAIIAVAPNISSNRRKKKSCFFFLGGGGVAQLTSLKL